MARIDVPFIVDGQKIIQHPKIKIAAGGKNYFYAVFHLCDAWSGIDYKNAVFTRGDISKIMTLTQGEDGSAECMIPWEVMTDVGYFDTGIFGGDKLPTGIARTFVIHGCVSDGDEPLAPTEDWFMKIERKVDGVQDGKSAYQIALDDGFVGTEQEWLASLKGETGYTPQKGVDYFTKDEINEVAQQAADIVEAEGGGGSDVIVFSSGGVFEPNITFDEALAAIEAGRSLMAYDTYNDRAYTLQYWDSNRIGFWSRVDPNYVMAESGIYEVFTYLKGDDYTLEFVGAEAFSFGVVTTNADGTLSCDKNFMYLFYDDFNLGKVIGLIKKDETELTVYHFCKVVPNDSTGGQMLVFGSPNGEFLGLGFDNSVFELPDYSVHVEWDNIKNRPFGDPITLVDNKTLTDLREDGIIIFAPTLELAEGKTYTVIYNGVEYKSTAIAFNDIPEVGSGVAIGNGAAFGFPDTGEPYIIAYSAGISLVIPLDGSTEVTLTVIEDGKKLDEKYLPDTVATKSYVEELLGVIENGTY